MKDTSRSPNAWPVLALLTGLNLFNYLDRYVLSAVLDPMQRDLHLTDYDLGVVNTAFMIGYFLTSPAFGYLGDRFSRRWLMMIGIMVWSLGTVLTGWAGTLTFLLAFRILVGVGEASYATISPSWISDLFSPARRNNALTIFYVAIPIGAALGYVIGGVIAAHFGWRYAFYWAGGPGLLFAVSLFLFPEPRRGAADDPSAPPAPTPRIRDFFHLFTITDFNLVVIGYIAYTFAIGAFGYWGPLFLGKVHGMNNETASNFFGGTLLFAGLGGTLIGGFLATAWKKRNPDRYAWVLALSILASIPLAFGAFLTDNVTISMTCIAADMLLLFLCTGPVNTIIVEAVPVQLRASAMAATIFAIHLFGDLWSGQLVGFLADRWHSLEKAVLILPVALIVCFGFWFALARRIARAR